MITFKQQFSYEEEAVKGFAVFLGWKEKLVRRVLKEVTSNLEGVESTISTYENEEYDNPETYVQYVERKSKEHSELFTLAWAKSLVKEQVRLHGELQRETIEAQILLPVKEALIVETIME